MQRYDFTRPVLRARLPCRRPKSVQQTHIVEPAFAGKTQAAEPDIVDIQMRIARLDFIWRQQRDIGAKCALDRMVLQQDILLQLVCGKVQIAPLAKGQIAR